MIPGSFNLSRPWCDCQWVQTEEDSEFDSESRPVRHNIDASPLILNAEHEIHGRGGVGSRSKGWRWVGLGLGLGIRGGFRDQGAELSWIWIRLLPMDFMFRSEDHLSDSVKADI